MPLYRVSGGSGLPSGGGPGQIIGQDDNGEVVWIQLPTASFRGEWAEDSVVWTYGFDTGLGLFTSGGNGTFDPPVRRAEQGNGAPGPYTQEVALVAEGAGSQAYIELNLAALDLSNLTRVKFWHRYVVTTFNDGSSRVTADGTEIFIDFAENDNWRQGSGSLQPGVQTLRFANYQRGNQRGAHAFAGIELYANADPYMLGQFVTRNGKMWKSLVNNNATTPGASAQWEEALTLPVESGSTAQRPAASLAGDGFQYYDTDLNKPLWSDGTAWRDAMGTAV